MRDVSAVRCGCERSRRMRREPPANAAGRTEAAPAPCSASVPIAVEQGWGRRVTILGDRRVPLRRCARSVAA